MFQRIAELLEVLTGAPPRGLELTTRPLRGGLVSPAVCAVTARHVDERGSLRITRWVVKQLDGRARREAAIYEALRRTPAKRLAPSVFAVEEGDDGALRLYLEEIVPVHPWPWTDAGAAGRVLHSLATLHDLRAPDLVAHASEWDYDRELRERAHQLVAALERHHVILRDAGIDLRLSGVRRLAQRLPEWRRALLADAPLGQSIIHGDTHPGNVIMTRRPTDEAPVPVLFDWERTRVGSPLEDVSSWLQTLAFWEPEARRRHDTLLGQYLLARGVRSQPSRALRDMYWLAAASNCLAGSLLYHLARATSSSTPREPRHAALSAVRDQLRILRRADACWS